MHDLEGFSNEDKKETLDQANWLHDCNFVNSINPSAQNS